jgi:hypothetical protein
MKKVVLMLLLAGFVVAGVIGCGSEVTTKKSTTTEKDKEAKPKDKEAKAS